MSILAPIIGLLVPGGAIGLLWKFGSHILFGKAEHELVETEQFALKNWKVTLGILFAIVIAGFCLYQVHERHKAERKIPAFQAAFAKEQQAFRAERAAFATEQASLNGALARIDENNRRILAEAADLEQAKRDAAAADARNAKLARSTNAQIAGLVAAAGAHKTPCVLSGAAMRELKNR